MIFRQFKLGLGLRLSKSVRPEIDDQLFCATLLCKIAHAGRLHVTLFFVAAMLHCNNEKF